MKTELLKIVILIQSLEDLVDYDTTGTQPLEGTRVPKIQLKKYSHRIAKYLKLWDRGVKLSYKTQSLSFLIIGIEYIKRTGIIITPKNVHRLMLVGTVLAHKYYYDESPLNDFYAHIGGVSLKEFNNLEYQFIKKLNWDFNLSNSKYKEITENYKIKENTNAN